MVRLVLLSILLPLAIHAEVPEFILVIEHGYPDETCSPTIDPRTHALGTYITVQDCAIAAKQAGVETFSYEPDGRFPGTCWKEMVKVTAELYASWSSGTGDPVCPGGGWVNATHTNTYAFAMARRDVPSNHAPAVAAKQPAKVPADQAPAEAPKQSTKVPQESSPWFKAKLATVRADHAPAVVPTQPTEVPADRAPAAEPKQPAEVPADHAPAVVPEQPTKQKNNWIKSIFKRHRSSMISVSVSDPSADVPTDHAPAAAPEQPAEVPADHAPAVVPEQPEAV